MKTCTSMLTERKQLCNSLPDQIEIWFAFLIYQGQSDNFSLPVPKLINDTHFRGHHIFLRNCKQNEIFTELRYSERPQMKVNKQRWNGRLISSSKTSKKRCGDKCHATNNKKTEAPVPLQSSGWATDVVSLIFTDGSFGLLGTWFDWERSSGSRLTLCQE